MIVRPLHKATSQRRIGSAATELAVILPFLILMFVGAVDFARIFYYDIILQNGARNGAYYASNYPGIYAFTSSEQQALADATNLNPSPAVEVKYSTAVDGPYDQDQPIPNGYVQVTLTWQFKSITNYPGIPGQVEMKRASRMRVAPRTPFDS